MSTVEDPAREPKASADALPDHAVSRVLMSALERAAAIGRPTAIAHVRSIRARERNRDLSPADVVTLLGRQFTASVSLSGGASGAAAAVPGVGAPAGLALAVADAGAFTSVAALYVFAMCEIYDIPTDDVERRRNLLLLVLLGNSGTQTAEKVAGRTAPHWARHIVKSVPASTLRQINKVLGRNFVTKYGTKQGILVLGKAVPAGVGAAIGAAGNAALAQFVVRSARRLFGPPPAVWPAALAPPRPPRADTEEDVT